MNNPKLLTIAGFLLIGLSTQFAYADEVDHTFGGTPGAYVSVDNDGGNDGDWDIEFNGINEISESNFSIWDDTNGVFYEGGHDDDFSGTGSAIVLVDPATGLGSVTEATGRSTGPYLPVTYNGGNYNIEQSTFASDTGQFVIIQLRITNTDASARATKLMFANDFDMDGLDTLGFETDMNLVWQQNPDSPYTTAGSALISGDFSDYRLGNCCDMTDPDEGDLAEDFVTGFSSGNQITSSDREVASLANFGTLASGQSACTAWVYAQIGGSSAVDGVQNLKDEVTAAIALYNTIPEGLTCGNIEVASLAPVPAMSWAGMLALLVALLGSALVIIRRI